MTDVADVTMMAGVEPTTTVALGIADIPGNYGNTGTNLTENHEDSSDSETPNTSAVSGTSSSTFSDIESSILSRKHKLAVKKWTKKEKLKQKQLERKRQKNKISKEDYYLKITEFKIWLNEAKKIKFENLNPKQHKEYFKKFVKKWNARKLDKKFYRGLDVLWAQGSPDVSWAAPRDLHMTPGSVEEALLEQKYSRVVTSREAGLGTFGKSSGAQMLRELRNMDNTEDSNGVTAALDPPDKSLCEERPRVLSLERMFLPPHQANKLQVEDTEEWPAPPSPFRINATKNCTTMSTTGGTEQVEDDLPLPPVPQNNCEQPRTSQVSLHHESTQPPTTHIQATSDLNLHQHNTKLIKVDVPVVKPVVACKPPTVPRVGGPRTGGAKPRPTSCMGAILPDKPIVPRRSCSTENVKERPQSCQLDLTAPGQPDPDISNRRRSKSDTQPRVIPPPPPPKRTVSLEKLSQMRSASNCSLSRGPSVVRTTSLDTISQYTSYDLRPAQPSQTQHCHSLENMQRPMTCDQKITVSDENQVSRATNAACTTPPGGNIAQKRTISECERLPNNSKVDNGISSRRGSVSEQPQKKVGRQDSYVSSLSSASYAVFQALSHSKGFVNPGEVTPVRLKPANNPCEMTPLRHHDNGTTAPTYPPGGPTSSVIPDAMLTLTPGKSSASTNL